MLHSCLGYKVRLDWRNRRSFSIVRDLGSHAPSFSKRSKRRCHCALLKHRSKSQRRGDPPMCNLSSNRKASSSFHNLQVFHLNSTFKLQAIPDLASKTHKVGLLSSRRPHQCIFRAKVRLYSSRPIPPSALLITMSSQEIRGSLNSPNSFFPRETPSQYSQDSQIPYYSTTSTSDDRHESPK